jgi:hypothetical protein
MSSKDERQAQRARTELALLRARYDGGAISPAVFAVIKNLECEIAWLEYQERTR